MVRVILKRIGLAFLTLFGVTVIVLALLQMMPRESIDSIAPLDVSEELRQMIINQYGFDQPFYMQRFIWPGNVVRGNFGDSVSDNRLVLSMVSEAPHNTLILALGASVSALLLSILIGVYSSYRPNSVFSWIGMVSGIGSTSIPNHCLSLILIGIFSVILRLLSSTGMYVSGNYTFPSLIQHLIPSAITAGAMTLGTMMRMVRSSVSEMRSRSFVITLRAKGLSEPATMRHVLCNSFPTLLIVAGLQFGCPIGGSTMVETTFSWPGIGLIIYQSTFTSDSPVTQAAILIAVAILVSINLLIDLLRIVVDPCLRKQRPVGYKGVIVLLSSIGSRAAADPEELHFRGEACSRLVRTFLRYPVALPMLILFVIVVLCALGAPLSTQYTSFEGSAVERPQGIGTAGHLLGTDEQGCDVLTRCLYGGRLSLLMDFLPVALATTVGSVLGVTSGYFGKAYAQIIIRTLDIFYVFPFILLATTLSSILSSGLSSIIIPAAVILVPSIARVAESIMQDIMPGDLIEAAQTPGASPLKVIVFFTIPDIFGRIFIYCTTQFSISILSASGLSFLGLGISSPTSERGSMLNALRQQVYINPLITIIPGLSILVTALSVNIILDGLKDAMEANS